MGIGLVSTCFVEQRERRRSVRQEQPGETGLELFDELAEEVARRQTGRSDR